MTTPGLTVRPFRQMTGSLEFAEVFFDDVRVPAVNRVGDAGDGWRIAMSTVSFERGPADVGFLADLRRGLRLADRRAPPTVALRDDGIRLARSSVDLQVLRAHILRTLSRRAKGLGSETEVSVDKLLMVRTEQALAHTTHGPARHRTTARPASGRAPRIPVVPGGERLRRLAGDPADDRRHPAARPAPS